MIPYGKEKIKYFPGKNGENNAWWYNSIIKILDRGSLNQKIRKQIKEEENGN
jgi:hypothetical protein